MDTVPNSDAPAPADTSTPQGATTADPSAGPAADKPLRMGTTPTGAQQKSDDAPAEPSNGTEGGDDAATEPRNGQAQEPDGDDVDYKTKFSESSKEAQRLLGIIKSAGIDPQTGQPIAQPDAPAPQTPQQPSVRIEQPPTPNVPLTDDQLTQAIPGFANLSEAEKNVIRDMKNTVKGITQMQKIVAEMHDERVYNQQFSELTGQDDWKGLAEHAEEFKKYAYQQENLEVPLNVLAASFMYAKGVQPAAKPASKPAPAGLEPGGGSGQRAGEDLEDGFTSEELAKIRMNDPKRYAKLAREGKLNVRKG